MLVIKGNSTLDGGVADYVAMCEVLSNDARTWLVFLRNVILVAGGVFRVRTG